MKSLLSKALIVSSLLSLNAMALEAVPRHCKVRTSEDQKIAIQKLAKESQVKSKSLRGELVAAQKALKVVLAASNATKEEALSASALVKEKRSSLQEIKSDLRLSVLFDVLSAEQRVKIAECEKRPVRHGRIERRGRHERIPHHRPHHRHHGRHGRGPRPVL